MCDRWAELVGHSHYCPQCLKLWPCLSVLCAQTPALRAHRERRCAPCVDRGTENATTPWQRIAKDHPKPRRTYRPDPDPDAGRLRGRTGRRKAHLPPEEW